MESSSHIWINFVKFTKKYYCNAFRKQTRQRRPIILPKMFSSISLMFSISLAFITWIILCYFKLIEDQRRLGDYTVELYTEHAKDTTRATTSCPVGTSFSSFLSFLWIFVSIYAFTKLVETVDRLYNNYKCTNTVKKQSTGTNTVNQPVPIVLVKTTGSSTEIRTINTVEKIANPPQKAMHDTESSLLNKTECCELYRRESIKNFNEQEWQMQQQKCVSKVAKKLELSAVCESERMLLLNRLEDLEKNCNEMNDTLSELKNSKESMSLVHVRQSQSQPSLAAMWPDQMPQQNIFISNSNITLSGKIFVGESTFKISTSNSSQSLRDTDQSEFRQVWSNYIQGPTARPMIANTHRRQLLLY